VLSSDEIGFLEAKQGCGERSGEVLGRPATIFTKAKAYVFTWVEFSKNLPVVGLHTFGGPGYGWIGQLALSREQGVALKLDGQRREGLLQVQGEIAGLKTQPKTVYSGIRAIRLCLIRAIGQGIRIRLGKLSVPCRSISRGSRGLRRE
jgi:hypothetical protein